MSNDKKYGRLYPERAVAPARKLLEELVSDSGLAEAASAIDALDSLGFPPDEPMFLLRGQDVLTPATVRYYAEMVKGSPECKLDVNHIWRHADAMESWTPRKMPD
jgi:hypothetical protein